MSTTDEMVATVRSALLLHRDAEMRLKAAEATVRDLRVTVEALWQNVATAQRDLYAFSLEGLPK